MSNQLEKYLRTVAAQLHGFPEDRREDEIEEIRAHLVAYATKEQSAGAGEEEAIQAAIRQFGEPGEVGRRIAKAKDRDRFQPVAFAICALVAAYTLLIWAFTNVSLTTPGLLVSMAEEYGPLLLQAIGCGLVLRKRAAPWMAWFYILTGVPIITVQNFLPHDVSFTGPPALFENIVSLLLRVGVSIAGAWIGARLAERLTRQRAVVSR